MKILALDQATNITGYAVFDGTDLYKRGIIDLHKEKDSWERMQIMRQKIDELMKDYKPRVVILEDVPGMTKTPQVLKELGRLQGFAMASAFSRGRPVLLYMPSEWRKILEIKQGRDHKRADLKRQAAEVVKNVYGIETTEDEADAICIGLAYLIESGQINWPLE